MMEQSGENLTKNIKTWSESFFSIKQMEEYEKYWYEMLSVQNDNLQ